jgi:hypothetical protein
LFSNAFGVNASPGGIVPTMVASVPCDTTYQQALGSVGLIPNGGTGLPPLSQVSFLEGGAGDGPTTGTFPAMQVPVL